MSETKLTKTERDTLLCCLDWSAHWEISERRSAMGDYSRNVSIIIGKLKARGLVEYGAPNGTFRISDAGRSALQDQRHEQ